jgi:hypothetical protein
MHSLQVLLLVGNFVMSSFSALLMHKKQLVWISQAILRQDGIIDSKTKEHSLIKIYCSRACIKTTF